MQDFTKRDMAQFKSYVAELDPNFDLDISGWGEGQSKHVHDIHRNSTGGYIDARTMLRSDTIYSIVFFNKHSQTPHIYAELSSHREDFNPVLKSLLHARFPFTLKAKDANAYFNEAFPGASDHDIPAKSVFEALSKAMRICFEEYVQPTPKALRTTATNLGLSRPQSFTPLDISRAFKEWADTHGLPQRLGVKIRDGQPTIWILSPSDQHNPLKSNLVWILQHRTNTDPDRPEQPHVYQYSAAQAAAQATAPIPPIDGATRRTLSNGGGHTDSDSECAEESPAESSRSSRSSSSSSSSSEEKKREKSKRRRRMLIMRRLSTVAAEWYKRMRGEGDNRVGPLELR